MDLASARHAFITGGASGIGLGIADALARRGLSVSLADVDTSALETVLASRSKQYRAEVFDVRDRAAWARAKASAEDAFGPVDILVNNAGIAPDGRDLADTEPDSFDRIVEINLIGVFNGVSAFAGDLRARGKGHIVNTASMAGLTASMPGLGAYAAAKFGVVAISDVLRCELEPHGVGVSVLCPGLVATNLPQNTVKLGGHMRNSDQKMPSSGVEAAQVGEMVAEGIAQNLPYIITHPDRWDSVAQRMEILRAAFQQA